MRPPVSHAHIYLWRSKCHRD